MGDFWNDFIYFIEYVNEILEQRGTAFTYVHIILTIKS